LVFFSLQLLVFFSLQSLVFFSLQTLVFFCLQWDVQSHEAPNSVAKKELPVVWPLKAYYTFASHVKGERYYTFSLNVKGEIYGE
jgi:hypothetical protein